MVITALDLIIWWSQRLMANKKNARQLALEALLMVNLKGGYSNIVLNKVLKKSYLSRVDMNFMSALFYGVLERKITLDYIIQNYSKIKFSKISDDVLEILRISLYQLLYMDKIPKSAAVNEGVNLAKYIGKTKATGFINGILRSFVRDGCKIILPDEKKSQIEHLSVKYSCPVFIINLWITYYGLDFTVDLLESLSFKSDLIARVNTLKISSQELQNKFNSNNILAVPSQLDNDALNINFMGSIEDNEFYKAGYFHIQDISSQICCKMLDAKAGQRVLDVCAAPGGKSLTIAQLMQNKGELLSCDIYNSKLDLLKLSALRLGIDIIKTKKRDAVIDKSLEEKSFDRILCDVPCSGLGIIRRKPEIRYKSFDDLENLCDLQYKILCNSASLLKENGILIYSTCTLNPKENNKIADKFLEEHKDFEAFNLNLPDSFLRNDFEPLNQHTFFPNRENTDGFFISAFTRVLR